MPYDRELLKSRKGIPRSEEVKRKISETKRKRLVDPLYRQKMGHKGVPNRGVQKYWNRFSAEERTQIMKNRLSKFKGIKRSPEVGLKVSVTKTGKPPTEAQKKGSIEAGRKLRGRKVTSDVRTKISSTLRKLWASGVLNIPHKPGKGEYYDSLLQGKIWLRSSSEVRFASFLDLMSGGGAFFVWLYEAERYPIKDEVGKIESTYCPDFWILPTITLSKVIKIFNSITLTPMQVKELLEITEIKHIVDIKGWFNKDHRTYAKICKFRKQYPEEVFDIVLDRRKSILEDKYVNEIISESLRRISVSGKKYGDSYLFADMPKEITEEIYDTFGWFLLSVSRLLRSFKDKVISIDNVFWDNFFKTQSDAHIKFLLLAVSKELIFRGNSPEKLLETVETDKEKNLK